MTPQEYERKLKQRHAKITSLFKEEGPKVVKGVIYTFFRDNYRLEQWYNNSGFEKWKPAKRKSQGTATDNKYPTLHSKRNALYNSIKAEEVPHGAAIFSKAIYAKIHNEGGTINTTVTPKMRRWAWAMYYKTLGVKKGSKKKIKLTDDGNGRKTTGNKMADFYRGIALTKKGKLKIEIPKRPFIYQCTRVRKLIIDDFKKRVVRILSN